MPPRHRLLWKTEDRRGCSDRVLALTLLVTYETDRRLDFEVFSLQGRVSRMIRNMKQLEQLEPTLSVLSGRLRMSIWETEMGIVHHLRATVNAIAKLPPMRSILIVLPVAASRRCRLYNQLCVGDAVDCVLGSSVSIYFFKKNVQRCNLVYARGLA